MPCSQLALAGATSAVATRCGRARARALLRDLRATEPGAHRRPRPARGPAGRPRCDGGCVGRLGRCRRRTGDLARRCRPALAVRRGRHQLSRLRPDRAAGGAAGRRRHLRARADRALPDLPAERSPWRDSRLLVLLGVQTCFAVVYLQSTIALPLSLVERGQQAWTLGVLLVVSALTMIVTTPVMRRAAVPLLVPDPTQLRVGYLTLGAGLAGYAVADSLPAYVAASAVAAVGDLFLMGVLLTVVAGLAPPRGRARYLAVFGLSWGIAAVLAPTIGIALLSGLGVAATWGLLAGGCVTLGLLARHVPAAEHLGWRHAQSHRRGSGRPSPGSLRRQLRHRAGSDSRIRQLRVTQRDRVPQPRREPDLPRRAGGRGRLRHPERHVDRRRPGRRRPARSRRPRASRTPSSSRR